MKTGIIIPIYKKKGLNPLLPSSYRGITIPPVLAKLYELIILRRLQPILSELNLPEKLQTAYQKGLSCSDAIFATQEAILAHLREGGHPYLCLFDFEKAFDSIEHCILLEKLLKVGSSQLITDLFTKNIVRHDSYCVLCTQQRTSVTQSYLLISKILL